MDFNKNALSKLLSLNDEEFAKVISEIAAEAGINTSNFSVSQNDVSRIRTMLALASNEEISQLLSQFGNKSKGGK